MNPKAWNLRTANKQCKLLLVESMTCLYLYKPEGVESKSTPLLSDAKPNQKALNTAMKQCKPKGEKLKVKNYLCIQTQITKA